MQYALVPLRRDFYFVDSMNQQAKFNHEGPNWLPQIKALGIAQNV
jgi:hypothetical protein